MNAEIQLTDPDLHAWLIGDRVAADLAVLSRGVAAILGPGRVDEAWWQQRHDCEEAERTRPTLEAIYRTCPLRLAERLHEGLNVYWAIGERALPPLLPLINPMVQAELHLYTKLDTSGKPYREHVVHTTRVAALSHLFLAEPGGVGLPGALRWDKVRTGWSHSKEYDLLRRFATRRGLDLPDPSSPGDPWGPWVRIAALLSGLIHDLGYLHKAIGEVVEKAARAVPWMRFKPDVTAPEVSAETPLGRFYRAVIDPEEHGHDDASLPAFLRRHYRPLHSVVGALWLAGLADALRPGYSAGVGPHPSCRREASMAELSFQLAALMAFAHDLALSDDKRRGILGMRQVERGGETLDVVNRRDYPLCTLFSLADVLQEFGRPVQVVRGDALRYCVPVAGVGLTPEGGGLRVRYLTRIPSRLNTSLMPRRALEERAMGAWRECHVGKGVESWLRSANLGGLIFVDEKNENNRLASYRPERGPGFGARKLVRSR